MPEELIGKVVDYYGKIGVAAIELTGSLKVGDKIHIKGHTTDFEQIVDSIQIDRKPVPEAKAGDSIGIKVNEYCRGKDLVYKVTE